MKLMLNSIHFRLHPSAFILSFSEVAASAARDGVREAREADADGAPVSVAPLVGRAVGEAVDGSEVCDDALVCAREVFEFLHFVESAAARVGQLLHSVVREVEGFGLNVFGAEGLVLRAR